jgi:hypothetical protein
MITIELSRVILKEELGEIYRHLSLKLAPRSFYQLKDHRFVDCDTGIITIQFIETEEESKLTNSTSFLESLDIDDTSPREISCDKIQSQFARLSDLKAYLQAHEVDAAYVELLTEGKSLAAQQFEVALVDLEDFDDLRAVVESSRGQNKMFGYWTERESRTSHASVSVLPAAAGYGSAFLRRVAPPPLPLKRDADSSFALREMRASTAEVGQAAAAKPGTLPPAPPSSPVGGGSGGFGLW